MAGVAGRAVLTTVTGLESYQLAVIRGLYGVLSEHGVPLLTYVNNGHVVGFENVDPGPAVAPSLECLLRHGGLLGVVLTIALSPDQQEALAELTTSLDLPVVYFSRDEPGQDCVRGDNRQGIQDVMTHLLSERGVRRPAMVRGQRHQPDHAEREEVFRAELLRHGLTIDEELFVDGESEREITRNVMRSLLSRRRDMDAVVTTDDDCAQIVVETLLDAGLRVPEDVLVTGFDNYPTASMNWPGLTTVDQNLVEQGAEAARMILARAGGAPPRGMTVTPCNLIVRGSTVGTEAAGTLGDVTVQSIARMAQARQVAHGALRRLGRGLTECRTLDDIAEALALCLPVLQIDRCFLVVHDGEADPPDGEGVVHRPCRLVLDFRGGRSNPVPDAVFSSCDLLPASLRSELAAGNLGYQQLTAADGLLGYLLTELPCSGVPVMEQLQLDVARTVRVVLSTQELEHRVEQRTRELRAAQSDLVDAARRAGMAEIATNVLHNVGNVLNSVNISASRVTSIVRGSEGENVRQVTQLIEQNRRDLAGFLAQDAKGRLLPEYLGRLGEALAEERQVILQEMSDLTMRIDHIKNIVSTQQSYAGSGRLVESVRPQDLVDDALRITAESLTRREVRIVLRMEELPPLLLDKGRLVPILVNLISNARAAMEAVPRDARVLTVRGWVTDGVLRMSVEDTGEGILEENLDRIFTHGFTTRSDGHGFGLHSCAVAATEMGGCLTAHSDGPGHGAVFTLDVPLQTGVETERVPERTGS